MQGRSEGPQRRLHLCKVEGKGPVMTTASNFRVQGRVEGPCNVRTFKLQGDGGRFLGSLTGASAGGA